MTTGYQNTILADAPFSYWTLDDTSGAVLDLGSGANNGTVSGTVTRAQSGLKTQTGNSDLFGGGFIDATVLTGFGSALASGFTIEFWIKTNTAAQNSVLGTIATGTTMFLWIALNTDNTQTLVAGSTDFTVRDNAGTQYRAQITTNIYDNNPHHVVWVFNGSNASTIYVDGASVAKTETGSIASCIDFGFSLYLGSRNNRGVQDFPLAGSLDEVVLYKTQLSGARVTAHYNAATFAPNTNTSVAYELNRLAGTLGPNGEVRCDAAKAANIWAGTSNLDMDGALAAKSGTGKKGAKGSANILAGTTNADLAIALQQIAS